MTKMTIEKSISEKFQQELLRAWQEGHGGGADQIHLFEGEAGLVLLIPQVLYQAEVELYRNSPGGGRVLNQYTRTLLQTVASDFSTMVAEMVGRAVGEVVPLIDLRAGWAIVFFPFKEYD